MSQIKPFFHGPNLKYRGSGTHNLLFKLKMVKKEKVTIAPHKNYTTPVDVGVTQANELLQVAQMR